MQAVLSRQKRVMVPGVPSVDRGYWWREPHNFLYRVLALRERRIIQNAVLCEESFGKNYALYVHLTYKNVDRFRNGSVQELYSL